jgi:hypothetical protein
VVCSSMGDGSGVWIAWKDNYPNLSAGLLVDLMGAILITNYQVQAHVLCLRIGRNATLSEL